MYKKLYAVLMSLFLTMTVLPQNVFAEEAAGETEEITETEETAQEEETIPEEVVEEEEPAEILPEEEESEVILPEENQPEVPEAEVIPEVEEKPAEEITETEEDAQEEETVPEEADEVAGPAGIESEVIPEEAEEPVIEEPEEPKEEITEPVQEEPAEEPETGVTQETEPEEEILEDTTERETSEEEPVQETEVITEEAEETVQNEESEGLESAEGLEDALLIREGDTPSITSENGEPVLLKFIPSETAEYSIRSFDNGMIDPEAVLLDENGVEVVTDYSLIENFNFLMQAELTAGNTYYIRAAMRLDGGFTYSLLVKKKAVIQVIFDANGGWFDNERDTVRAVEFDSADSFSPLYNPNHSASDACFLGWATSPYAKEPDVFGDDFPAALLDTVYAVWDDKVEIILDANGGIFNNLYDDQRFSEEYVKGTTIDLFEYKEEAFVDSLLRECVGFSEDPDALPADAVMSYTVNGPAVLYAIYREYPGTEVSLNQTVSGTVEAGSEYRILFTPEETGSYTFITEGRYSSSDCYDERHNSMDYYKDSSYDGSGGIHENGTVILEAGHPYYVSLVNEKTEDSEFTAQIIKGESVSVTYDANGGYIDRAGEPSSFTEITVRGSRFRDKGEDFVKHNDKHLRFAGWAASPDALTPDIDSSMEISSDVTVYAVWENAYLVYTFDANGGEYCGDPGESVPRASYSANYGDEIYLRTDCFEPSFWQGEFIGVALTPDADESDILPDEMYTITEDVTFYAIYRQIEQYTLIEDEITEIQLHETTAAAVFEPAESGDYKLEVSFSGGIDDNDWVTCSTYDEENGSTDEYYCPTSIPLELTGGKTYYFRFTNHYSDAAISVKIRKYNAVTVTYDANGGWFDNEEDTVREYKFDEDDTFQLRCYPNHPDPDMQFAGWATSPDAEERDVSDNETPVSGLTTVYAVWKEIAHLTEGVPSHVGSTVGDYTVLRFTPSETGVYRIWSSANDGNDPYGQVDDPDDDHNLLCEDDDSAGNLNFLMQLELTAGITYSVRVRDASWNSYSFNVTVIRHDPVNITFDANGGRFILDDSSSVSYKELEFEKGEQVDLSGITPSNYVWQGDFLGWALSPDADETGILPDNEPYIFEGDMTLYAVYEELEILTLQEDVPAEIQLNGPKRKVAAFTPAESGSYMLEFSDLTGLGEDDCIYCSVCDRYNGSYNGLYFSYSPCEMPEEFIGGKTYYFSLTDEYSDAVITLKIGKYDSCTVTYDANGGSFSYYEELPVHTSKVRTGSYFVEYDSPYTNDDRCFSGWATAPDATEPDVDCNTVVSGDMTVYAVWMPAIRVTYNGNGGQLIYDWIGEPERDYYFSPGATFMCPFWEHETSKVLIGWATSPDALEPDVDENTVITEPMTVYAVWREAYVVTFYANGGGYYSGNGNQLDYMTARVVKNSTFGESFSSGDNAMCLHPVYENESVGILGWATTPDALEPDVGPDTVISEDMTVYAVWEPSIILTFDANGGTLIGEVEGSGYRYVFDWPVLPGTALSCPLIIYHDDSSMVFTGWATTPDAAVPDLDENTVITEPMTVYAVWEEGYQLTFDANGGYYGKNDYVSTQYTTAVRKDITFGGFIDSSEYYFYNLCLHPSNDSDTAVLKGWATTPDAEEPDIGEDTVIDGPMTIYAVWDDKVYVSYDANGGIFLASGMSVLPGEYQRGSYFSEPTDTIVHEDESLAFSGWADSPDAEEPNISSDTVITGDMTVYAVWKRHVTVTFDAGSGYFNGDPDNSVFVKTYLENDYYNSADAPVPEPADPSQEFCGWSENDSIAGISDRFCVSHDTVLHAVYMTRTMENVKIMIAAYSPIEYTGEAIEPESIVFFNNRQLIEETDYTIRYVNNRNVGTASVIFTGIGDFAGTAERSFSIIPKAITPEVTLAAAEIEYSGAETVPEIIVRDGDTVLAKDTDYTVSYDGDRIDTGTYTLTVTLKGNYTGSASASFTVIPKAVTPAVTLTTTSYTYNGSAKTPGVTVKDGNQTLVKNTDYTVSYASGRTDAGTYNVKVTLKGNYSGTKTVSFRISPKAVSGITLTPASYTYDGKAKTPATVKDGDQTLVKGTDYTISYKNNINAGTASAVITGKGNYTGSVTKNFTIKAKAITPAVTLTTTSYTYNGSAKTPGVTVKDGTKTLAKGTDYTVSYASGRINVGTYTVKVTLKGNYSGSKSVSFKINKAAQTITAKAAASSVAVGKTTTVSVTGNQGTVSYKSSDTTVAAVSTAGKITAKKVGTATITVTAAATANYNAASKTVTVKVIPAATASVTAENLATGMKVTWKKVAGATGYLVYRNDTQIKKITSGSTVSYTDTKANTNGTKYTYKIVAYAATGNSTLSASVTAYRVARPAISSLTNSAPGRITLMWGRNSKATGYEIQYSTSSDFTASTTKTVTVTKNTTVSKMISKLTKGKTYYVRIRSYKTVSSKKHYSAWSAVKKLKIII